MTAKKIKHEMTVLEKRLIERMTMEKDEVTLELTKVIKDELNVL